MSWCQRSLRETFGVVICLGALSVGMASCSLFTRDTAKTVLDIAMVTCAIAHAETDDQTVAQICGIADDLIPDLKRLLAEHRKQARKAACYKLMPDVYDGGK